MSKIQIATMNHEKQEKEKYTSCGENKNWLSASCLKSKLSSEKCLIVTVCL